MDFRAGQIWKSKNLKASLTVLGVTGEWVTFRMEADGVDKQTKWQSLVLESVITNHGFNLVEVA